MAVNKGLEKHTEIQQPRDIKPLQRSSEDKVLGVVWNSIKDVLSFVTKVEHNQPNTKRRILSQVAKVYDPIGFATAFLIRAKIGMQELWQMGVDWDDELDPAVQAKWKTFFEELGRLKEVSFPRGLFTLNSIGLPILCIFADASEYAFGACAYLRWQKRDGTFEIRFVAAKSRVAPLKKLTIPQLKLLAALLASRLSKIIQEETCHEFAKVIYFIDSAIS